MKGPLLIETIKVENGEIFNLERHDARFNRSRRILFGREDALPLVDFLDIPKECRQGLFKCRVTYGPDIESIEFEPYRKRTVRSLKLVVCDEIEYSFKFKDRSALEALFAERGDCDDIIIVKNGLVTDSFYANLVFDDGENLYTPAHPLLKGTKREVLLEQGILKEADIRPDDLVRFRRIHQINAMLDLET
jgi:4-amino-4-deoxychorismate lyase